MPDNPFEPAGDFAVDGADYGPNTLEPVGMDLGALFGRAWEVMRENLGIVIGAVAVSVGVQVVFSVINQLLTVVQQNMANEGADEMVLVLVMLNLVIQIVGGVIGLWIGLGIIRIMVNLVNGRMASIGMAFGEGKLLLPAIGIGIIVGIGTTLGMLLFVVPGIILALALQFANYELVDRDADIGGALQGSWALAWPHMWTLFGIWVLIIVAVVIGGLLTCGLGFLLAAVFLPVLQAVIYQSLRHDQELRAGEILS